MKGFEITFYTRESEHKGHKTIAQWLIEHANTMGLHGATLIKASEGFGIEHKMHAARFFDLSDEPLVVTMVVTEEEQKAFFVHLQKEDVNVFYTLKAVEFGMTIKDINTL